VILAAVDFADRILSRRRGLARRTAVLLALTGGVLGGLPSSALALTASASYQEDGGDGYPILRVSLSEPRGGESNAITINRDGRVRDEGHELRYDGPDEDDGGCARESSHALDCESVDSLAISSGARDDTIDVEVSANQGRAVYITPGPGRDQVRLGYPGGPYRLALADGEVDTVTCESLEGRGEVVSRDPQDQFVNCGGNDNANQDSPPRLELYARRAQRRGAIIGRGVRATCSASEPVTCSATASISRSAARALGIRTRSRRYVIARGQAAIAAPGRQAVGLRLTRRARSSLRGRRVRALRVLLSATAVDRGGNRSTDLFTVTLRG